MVVELPLGHDSFHLVGVVKIVHYKHCMDRVNPTRLTITERSNVTSGTLTRLINLNTWSMRSLCTPGALAKREKSIPT